MKKLIKSEETQKKAKTTSSKNGLKFFILGLVVIQVFLTIVIYNSMSMGLVQLSEFWVGLNLLIYAGIFGIYHFGIKKRKFINFQFG